MNRMDPHDEPTPEQQASLKHWMPTRAEIEAEKRRIREEKGEADPIPEKPVRYSVIEHLLTCDVDDLGDD